MEKRLIAFGAFCFGVLFLFSGFVFYCAATGKFCGEPDAKQRGKDTFNQYVQGIEEAKAELSKKYDLQAAEADRKNEESWKKLQEEMKQRNAEAAERQRKLLEGEE